MLLLILPPTAVMTVFTNRFTFVGREWMGGSLNGIDGEGGGEMVLFLFLYIVVKRLGAWTLEWG